MTQVDAQDRQSVGRRPASRLQKGSVAAQDKGDPGGGQLLVGADQVLPAQQSGRLRLEPNADAVIFQPLNQVIREGQGGFFSRMGHERNEQLHLTLSGNSMRFPDYLVDTRLVHWTVRLAYGFPWFPPDKKLDVSFRTQDRGK